MGDTSSIKISFPGTDSLYAPSFTRKILFAILVCLLSHYLYKQLRRNPRHQKFARSLPGPWALPIVGNSWLFIFSRNADAITSLFSQYTVQYGSRFRLWIGRQLLVVMTDVHDIRAVLLSNKNSEKPEMMSSFREFFGDCLAFAPADLWLKSRKAALPFFMSKQRNHIITKMVNQYVDNLREHVDGPQFNLSETLENSFFGIITKTFFDVELTEMERNTLQFHQQVDVGSELSITRTFRPWLHSKFISDIFYGKKWHDAKRKLFNFAKKIMMDNANKIEKFTNQEVTPESFPFRYLATLIQDEKDQGIDDLAVSNVVITMAAGADTTIATSSFFVLTLAMFPEIQDKLYEEIYSLYGDDDRETEIDDVLKLQYLDQVMKEVLRRFTVLPLIFRKINEDTKINDVIYPAGTAFLMSLANVHHDPALYPNPQQFNPDNFSPENVANRPKGSYVPFSAGPRNCIGIQFATVVMKLFIVTLLRSFRVHTTFKVEEIDLKVGFTSHNRSGCPVSITKRKEN